MDGMDVEAPRGVSRALIGVAAALGGAALFVFLGTGSARAETAPDADPGLLGGALHTVSATVQTLESAVSSPSAPAAPAAAVAPAPHAPAAAAPPLTAPAPAAASPTPPRGLVRDAVAPVASAVDSTVVVLPVVGSVVRHIAGPTPVAELTAPLTSLVDTALGTTSAVVGSTVPPVPISRGGSAVQVSTGFAASRPPAVPAARGPDAPHLARASTAAVVISDAVSRAAASLASWPLRAIDPGGPAPVSSGSSSAAGSAALLAGVTMLALPLLPLRRLASRFAAPGAPVFDTDSSPD